MLLIRRLRELGCDMDRAMERFLQDEAFYRQALMDFRYAPEFSLLSDAIRGQDREKALDNAFILKSVIDSMEIQQLQSAIVSLIELLRNNDFAASASSYERLLILKESFYSKIEGCL